MFFLSFFLNAQEPVSEHDVQYSLEQLPQILKKTAPYGIGINFLLNPQCFSIAGNTEIEEIFTAYKYTQERQAALQDLKKILLCLMYEEQDPGVARTQSFQNADLTDAQKREIAAGLEDTEKYETEYIARFMTAQDEDVLEKIRKQLTRLKSILTPELK